MSSVVQSDVFFFITGFAVILLSLALFVALVYVILVFRKVKEILEVAKRETQLIAEDIDALRSNVKQEGLKMKSFLSFIQSIYKRKKSNKK
jgi:uncharacterized protein YoxC